VSDLVEQLRRVSGGSTVVALVTDAADRIEHLERVEQAWREAHRTGDGPSCEDVCLDECLGPCGVSVREEDPEILAW
jgi:hypothetical protein